MFGERSGLAHLQDENKRTGPSGTGGRGCRGGGAGAAVGDGCDGGGADNDESGISDEVCWSPIV